MTKKNNKKTPEPMFVGTEPEEMVTTDALPGSTQESPITDDTDYFFKKQWNNLCHPDKKNTNTLLTQSTTFITN